MGKRITRLIILFIIVLSVFNSRLVFAKTVKQPYLAEQAKGKAPDVKVYLTGSKLKSTVSVSGQIEQISLQQNGEVVSFDQSGEGLHYIILLDNSGSIDEVQFKESKRQLISLCRTIKANDRFTLYTVGTYNSGGEKKKIVAKLSGSDKKQVKKAIKRIKKIKYLKSPKSKTVLYRSLNEVLATWQAPVERSVVLMITDGEDDSRGKDIDQKSTADEVKNATIPVYGILLHNVARKPNKAKMKYTQYKILNEKNCRGYYEDCSNRSSAGRVKKAFQVIRRLWERDTYVVSLRADSNRMIGKTKLQLTVNQQGIDPVTMDYSDYEKDEAAPVFVGAVKKISSNSISFSLQDDNGINVDDANDPSHYLLQSKTEEGNGKIWNITDVNTKNNGKELLITLCFAEDLFTDQYVLLCNDIHDNSQDQNFMKDFPIEFSIEDGLNRVSAQRKEFIKSYWWIAFIVLVVILGMVIVIAIKKRPAVDRGMDPEELTKADTKLIRLTITDRAGAIKDVEWNVEGSLFIGRSKICNIDFDDDRLSKQHFVVEVTKMGCYIEDLESTNGTFVNGVKMTNRRMLLDGDVITAGREKFVFHLPKNQLTAHTNDFS